MPPKPPSHKKERYKYAGAFKKNQSYKLSNEGNIYFVESNWKRGLDLLRYISDDHQKTMLNKHGIYNMKTNKCGLVRDHIYSRHDGFINKVFPELLRHPANLQLINHSINLRKGISSRITLEDLFDSVKNFSANYYEQDFCIDLINRYESGERWRAEMFVSDNPSKVKYEKSSKVSKSYRRDYQS